MALKHDSEGFLVGEPANLGRMYSTWSDIRKDVKDIKSALLGKKAPKPAQVSVATTRTRKTAERKVSQPTTRVRTEKPTAATERKTPSAQHTQKPETRKTGKTVSPVGTVKPQKETPAPTAKTADKRVGKQTAETKTVKTAQTEVPPKAQQQTGKQQTAETKVATPTRTRRKNTEAETPSRDSKGRFVAKDGDSSVERAEESRRAGEFAEKVGEAVKDAGQNLEEVDPTVKAVQEIAAPIQRGYSMFFGGQRDDESPTLIKRFMRLFQRTHSAENAEAKETNKSLKKIFKHQKDNEGKGGAKGGGLFSGLTSLLPGMGALAVKGLKKVPFLGALAAGASSLFEFFSTENDPTLTPEEKRRRHGQTGGSLVGGVGGMFGGAKLGAMAGAVFGPVGVAIGGTIGALAGGFFGDQAGKIVGEKVGGWTNQLIQADIPGKISGTWNSVTGTISSTWNELKTSLGKSWNDFFNPLSEKVKGWVDAFKEFKDNATKNVKEKVQAVVEKGKELVNEANEVVKEKTGIDVKAKVENLTAKAEEKATAVKNTAVEAYEKSKSYLSEKAEGLLSYIGFGKKDKKAEQPQKTEESKAPAPAQAEQLPKPEKSRFERALDYAKENTLAGKTITNLFKAKDWILGQTSKKFESGRGGAGTVSSGKGDAGGASYGTYQLASKTGTLQKFLNSTEYGQHFEGLTPGTAAFNAKWKELAATDSNFGAAQLEFIKNTHYAPALENLRKNGIDLSGRGRAVHDALWSTSVQFGAGGRKNGATGMFLKALAGKDVNAMSDAEIVSAIQDYKITNNSKLFRRSSAEVQQGTLNRAYKEKNDLLKLAAEDHKNGFSMAQQSPATVSQALAAPSVVNLAAADVPTAAQVKMAQPPETQSIPSVPQVAANPGNKQIPTVRIESDITQDLGDRAIAHIVTGGLSGSAKV